jgi:hypothetical protein
VCSDFSFNESRHTDNYKATGITAANDNGYVKYFGYSEDYDWLFIPSAVGGTNAIPVGDYLYVTANLNGYRIARLGGYWYDGMKAGALYWSLNAVVGARGRGVGARLFYVKTQAT